MYKLIGMASLGWLALGPAATPAEPWSWQHPVVLGSFPVAELTTFCPTGVCWSKERPALGLLKGAKFQPKYEVWFEGPEGWQSVPIADRVQFATGPFALGDDVGVIARVGVQPLLAKGAPKGAGNPWLRLLRVHVETGQVSTYPISSAPLPEVAAIPLAVTSWNEAVHVLVLRASQPKAPWEIWRHSSGDGGKTWQPPAKVAETTMTLADLRQLCVVQWSAQGFGYFLEEDDRMVFVRTEDGGGSWRKEAVALRDRDKPNARRLPLTVSHDGDEILLAYLAQERDENSDPSAEGTCYLARSRDRQSWSQGSAIVTKVLADPASIVEAAKMVTPVERIGFVPASLAAAGAQVGFSVIHIGERGQIQSSLFLSEDRGERWQRVPLDHLYPGPAESLLLSRPPAADRLLYTAAIRFRGVSLVAQELSPRPVPKLTQAQLEQVRALLAQLADDKFSVREEANKKLQAFGPVIKDELLAARKRAIDPEAHMRIQRMLDVFFPFPLKVE